MSTQVRVTGIPRSEPDYQRLARALLVLMEESGEEKYALGDDPLAPPANRQPMSKGTHQEPADEEDDR
jgi:hypothetical protein